MRLLTLLNIALAAAAPLQVTVVETVVTTVIVDPNQTAQPKKEVVATPTTEPTTQAPVTTAPPPATTQAPPPTTTAAAPTTATAAAGGDDNTLLSEHNAKRSLHGVPPLSWDASLAAYAAQYASQYDCSGTLTHSGGPHGENLALGYGIAGAVDAWYSEGANYNYGSSCSVLDHFTQVVWKSTTKVGCAVKSCGDYWGDYVICSYDPPGNYIGQCSSNVVPPV